MMTTIALALQTDVSRYMIAVSFPAYRPSSLLLIVMALALAVAGMGVDVALGLTVGSVALPVVALATWLTFSVLFSELWSKIWTKPNSLS